MKKLGIPTTIGELREMTKQFPDETLLQFRNEPRHELTFEEQENMGLIFQEVDNPDIKGSLMRILAKNAYSMGNMQIDNDVSKLCKAIYYFEGQLDLIIRFADEEYKQELRDSISCIKKNACEILNK